MNNTTLYKLLFGMQVIAAVFAFIFCIVPVINAMAMAVTSMAFGLAAYVCKNYGDFS